MQISTIGLDIAKNVFQVHGIDAAEQQGQLMQHRTRDVLIRQRTQIINALRAHLAELGLVAAQGNAGVNELRAIVTDEQDTRLPIDARASVIVLAAQLEALESVIGAIESGSRCSIARARRASGLRRSRASGLSGRLRSWQRWRTPQGAEGDPEPLKGAALLNAFKAPFTASI